jgi:hypothetical protein
VFQRASDNDDALVYRLNIPPVFTATLAFTGLIHLTQKLDLHGRRSTYQQVSHAFDTAPGFEAVKADIAAYLGRQSVD